MKFCFSNLLFACIVLLCGCGFDKFNQNRLEIIDGLEWRRIGPERSQIFWNQGGFKVEGNLVVTFCDDGVNVDVEMGHSVYVDVIRGKVLHSQGSFVPSKSSRFKVAGEVAVFSADDVMGPNGCVSYQRFIEEQTDFKIRLESWRETEKK